MSVAQSFTLLYRRIAFCERPQSLKPAEYLDVDRSAECNSAAQQSETLRYEPERSPPHVAFFEDLFSPSATRVKLV